MKKIFIFLTVFFAAISNLSAQTTMFTSYTFNVEPKNEQTVLKLYNDYFGKKEHLAKGVSVSLFQNHFKSNDDATHEVVFVGTPEAMGVAYDSPSDASWKLFQSELSKFCIDKEAASGTRLSSFGDESNTNYLVQDVIFQKITDSKLFKEKFDAYWSKNLQPNTRLVLGSISRRMTDGTTHYVIISHKDFSSKFKYKPLNEDLQKEYANSVKEIRTYTKSRTRVLLGKW